MAAIMNALDNHTQKQIGENGHIEYGWSNNLREKICQFTFQLVRTTDTNVLNLRVILRNILITINTQLLKATVPEKEVLLGYLSVLYKVIGHTRDIIDGKGEYTLTYMMIYTWYEFYPELAFFALKCLVDLGDPKLHQYGCWKDLKYFCSYCKSLGADVSHPLIQYSIQLINDKISQESTLDDSNISLISKWVPREKSSFSWLYEPLSTNYFKQYLLYARTPQQQKRAILKCKTEYRKLLSSLNKRIDTLQIKQCGKDWSGINFDKVTSISFSKQKKAFLNVKKDGSQRYPESQDRVTCAGNFKAHIQKAVTGEKEVKGKRVGLENFTKQALDLLMGYGSQEEKDLLNSQWRDNASQTGALGKMIAMVDVSGSMEGDPMNVAIALGIRVAEKNILGKRVLTFSSSPSWVNLDGFDDFVSQVEFLKRANWGMNTNLYAAFDMILDAIIENKLSSEDVQDMSLVIFSDMQIDAGDNTDKQVLYDKMKEKYEQSGIRVHGKPYKPPHIIFWNLRSTNGFPTLSTQPNVSMMSGFSPSLLNLFCEQGIEALQSCTPWSMLEKSLENKRYDILSDKLCELVV
uniref:VWFA domain-containing protein n=1 Tax=viral metagenome TaxID=1070528 RepID=A0A6C0IFD2_9ZZZZ